MSHKQFFSRVLFCMAILLGRMAPLFGMDVPKSSVNVKNDHNKLPKGKEEADNQSSNNSYAPLRNLHEEPDRSLPFGNMHGPKQTASRPNKYCITFSKESITEMDQVFATAQYALSV